MRNNIYFIIKENNLTTKSEVKVGKILISCDMNCSRITEQMYITMMSKLYNDGDIIEVHIYNYLPKKHTFITGNYGEQTHAYTGSHKRVALDITQALDTVRLALQVTYDKIYILSGEYESEALYTMLSELKCKSSKIIMTASTVCIEDKYSITNCTDSTIRHARQDEFKQSITERTQYVKRDSEDTTATAINTDNIPSQVFPLEISATDKTNTSENAFYNHVNKDNSAVSNDKISNIDIDKKSYISNTKNILIAPESKSYTDKSNTVKLCNEQVICKDKITPHKEISPNNNATYSDINTQIVDSKTSLLASLPPDKLKLIFKYLLDKKARSPAS